MIKIKNSHKILLIYTLLVFLLGVIHWKIEKEWFLSPIEHSFTTYLFMFVYLSGIGCFALCLFIFIYDYSNL